VYSGSAAEVLSGILTVNPAPVSSGISGAPVELDRLLAKALEKDRDLRYRTASELRTDLKRVKRDLDAPAAAPAPSATRWRGLMLPAGAALLAVIGAGAYWVLTPPPAATALLADATFSQVTDLPGLETFPSLAPDGQSLVFASAHEGPWHIYSQRIGGRNLINLTADSTADNTQPALSPDGSRIAFRSSRDGGGIFIMGATGESVRRLTDLGYNPSWSPDATSIAFATEVVDAPTSRMSYSAVWAVDVATGDRRVITEDNAVQPSWSPDGARIAYWKVDSSGNRDIYTVPATGGEPVAITSDTATDWSPAWSPDGRFLFFSSDRGGSMNLWRVAIDAQSGRTMGPFEPITTPALNSGLLNFSRDGTRIAYVSQIASRNISRVDFDARLERTSSAPVPVTRGSRYLRFPSVSPDGKSIAYTSDEKLVVSLVDGSEFRQLTDGEFRDRAPRWSPDGSTLLFYSNRTGTYEVWSVRLDGSGLRQVTYGGPDVTFFYPVWSPDGRRVAFGDLKNRLNYFYDLETPWPGASPPALPPVPEARAVFAPWSWSAVAGLAGWTLREDGQSGGILIFDPASRSYRRLPGAGTRPLWLPDDRRLLTIDASGLSVVEAATGAARHLNVAAPLDDEFSLAPDASTIYFMQTERTGDIWVITLTEGNQAGR
jgi:Tol biopolymer transport system component